MGELLQSLGISKSYPLKNETRLANLMNLLFPGPLDQHSAQTLAVCRAASDKLPLAESHHRHPRLVGEALYTALPLSARTHSECDRGD